MIFSVTKRFALDSNIKYCWFFFLDNVHVLSAWLERLYCQEPSKDPGETFFNLFKSNYFDIVFKLISLFNNIFFFSPSSTRITFPERVWSLLIARLSCCLSMTTTTNANSSQTTTRTFWLSTETPTSILKPWFCLSTGEQQLISTSWFLSCLRIELVSHHKSLL